MAIKHKISGRTASMPMGIGMGILICVATMLICDLMLAYLVVNETVSLGVIGIGAMLAVAISSALGGLCGFALVKQKRLLVSGFIAVGFYLVMLSITAAFFDGVYASMGITALMVLAGAGSTLLFGLRKKTGKSKIKIPAYR